MGDLLLNLDELTSIHDKAIVNRTKIFNEILGTCHNKIRKYNTEFKKQDCLFEPPVFIIGKPPYNYLDLVNYIISLLRKNGLRAEWLPIKKAIYISWRKTDIDMTQYRNQFTNMNIPTGAVYLEEANSTTQPFSILSVHQPDTSSSKKKKDRGEKQSIQHVAMLEYSPGVKDYVPINIQGVKR